MVWGGWGLGAEPLAEFYEGVGFRLGFIGFGVL